MRTLAAAAAIALLLVTSGCGGRSKDETSAAKSIGASFAGKSPTTERKKVGQCFGDTLVDEAGLDRLKKDKVIGSDLKAAKTVPQSLTSKTAEAYGDGIVKCIKYDDLKADIKKQTGASTAQVSAYVTCMDKIKDADLKQAVIDGYTKKNKQTAAVKKVSAATTTCGKLLGS